MYFFANFLILQIFYCFIINVQSLFHPPANDFLWNFEQIWKSDTYQDNSRRNYMRREHKLVAGKVDGADDFKSVKNIKGGDSQFKYIPPINHRQVRILDFSNAKEQKKQETVKKYTKIIEEKVPIYEDKEKVQELERSLLEKGIWAICKWAFPLPHPLDKDEQCTQSELKFLLQR